MSCLSFTSTANNNENENYGKCKEEEEKNNINMFDHLDKSATARTLDSRMHDSTVQIHSRIANFLFANHL